MTLATYESLFTFTEYSPGSIPFYIGIGHDLIENIVEVYTCTSEVSYFENINYDTLTYIGDDVVLGFRVPEEQVDDFKTIGNNILTYDYPLNMYVSTYDEDIEVSRKYFLDGVSDKFLNKFYEKLPVQYRLG